MSVVPGITALQALTAAHAIALNEINAPVTITTGRTLRDHGWPQNANTIAVMLDGDCAFQHLAPEGVTIWWGLTWVCRSRSALPGRWRKWVRRFWRNAKRRGRRMGG